jgi:Response regulator containing CheY-like receiver, AAA-type ATPase, and DNA-binding domains
VASAQSTTVLVVDDEPSIRLLCRVNLELEGFTVLEASSVRAARDVLAAEQVDVLLVDVHIGDADGRDLIRELREAGDAPRCALLTGTVQLSPDDRGGADDVIEKPFSLDTLISTVKRLAGHDVDSSMS